MCNRARNRSEPETLFEHFRAEWATPRPLDNRFNWQELSPKSRAYVIRQNDRGRGLDVMNWDVLGGRAAYAMTNVRDLGLGQWKRLAEKPENRCLVPLTEFCEWAPQPIDLGDGKGPLGGEMWFTVTDQPLFAVAGLWQPVRDGLGFTIVTCDPNELVAPIHPRTMITILQPDDWDRWLCGSYEDVIALQRPYPAEFMTVRGLEFPTRRLPRAAATSLL